MLHIDLVPRHPYGAASEGHGSDHGKKFRRQAHREGNGENEGFECILVHGDAHDQDEEHKKKDGAGDQQTKMPQAALEVGFFRPVGQSLRNGSECGMRAGSDHASHAGSTHD